MKTLSEDILKYDPSFKLDRYTFRSNVDYNVTKWLSAYLNLGTYIEKVNMPNPGVMYGGDRNWLVRDMLYRVSRPFCPSHRPVDHCRLWRSCQ